MPASQSSFSVLFVCLGNICRSPMAEIVLKQLVKQKKLENLIPLIDSCGTAGYHTGEEPDDRTIETCKKHYGKQLVVDHLARQFKPTQDLQKFDYVLVMDRNNYRDVLSMCKLSSSEKVKLLGSFDPKQESETVADPYYGGMSGFEHIFHQITRCCEALIAEIQKRSSSEQQP